MRKYEYQVEVTQWDGLLACFRDKCVSESVPAPERAPAVDVVCSFLAKIEWCTEGGTNYAEKTAPL